MTKYKRRKQLIVSKRFQFKFIGQILGIMFAAVFLTGYLVYVTTWVMFGEKLAAVYPQGLLMDIVSKVNMVLFLRMLFLTPLVIIIGMILSNRIAGPVYHMQSFLRTLYSGDYSKRLKLRKGDEMQDLAASINLLVSKLDSLKKKRTSAVEEIENIISDITRILDDNAERCDAGAVSEQLKGLNGKIEILKGL